MKTYLIEVNEKQARIISRGMEIFARLGIGQFRDALEQLPLKPNDVDFFTDCLPKVGELLKQHMVDHVDGWSSNLGIHSPKVHETSRIAWDLYQVIRQRVAIDRAVQEEIIDNENSPRKWPEMMGVCYDDPMVSSTEPLAKIKAMK